MFIRVRPVVWSVCLLASVSSASAQSIGTFAWQQQPFCNVITLNVVQNGAIYLVDGFDDQCGAGTRAASGGIAFQNPNGSIGFGVTIVTSPGGTPLHIDATIDLGSLSGTWRDSSGGTGAWVFAPGGSTSGAPRPVPRASFPAGISAGNTTITNVATPVSGTDAATKTYVDAAVAGSSAADRAFAKTLYATTVNLSAYGADRTANISDANSGCLGFPAGGFNQARLDLPLPIGALPTAITVKYVDSSSTTSLSFGLRVYTFQEGVSRQDSQAAAFFNSTNGPVGGVRTQTVAIASPQPVTAARGYYINATGANSGIGGEELAFCGAQVAYTLP